MPRTRFRARVPDDVLTTTAEARTLGNLIKACMAHAAADPTWRAYGPPENFKTPSGSRWRQKLVRPSLSEILGLEE